MRPLRKLALILPLLSNVDGSSAVRSHMPSTPAGGVVCESTGISYDATPLGQSGGTAAFYELKPRQNPTSPMPDAATAQSAQVANTPPRRMLTRSAPVRSLTSSSRLIGKSIARAADELAFYDALRTLQNSESTAWTPLLNFFLKSHDSCRLSTADKAEYLVMERLGGSSDFKSAKPRIFDIKIGARTALGGWQGKSRVEALQQDQLDKMTNTAKEAFRLEGVDNKPLSLKSHMDMYQHKKQDRLNLQSLSGIDIFSFVVDPTTAAASSSDAAQLAQAGLWQVAVLQKIVEQLHAMYLALRNIPTPQVWMGSSVALVVDLFDSATPPTNPGVEVKLFDWGRSVLARSQADLNALQITPSNALKYWNEYLVGIRNLVVDAAVSLRSRVFYTNEYAEFPVTVQIWDFNVLAAHKFIGQVEIFVPVADERQRHIKLPEAEYTLYDLSGQTEVRTAEGIVSKVKLEVEEVTQEADETAERVFVLKVKCAVNLPKMNLTNNQADPFVKVLMGKYHATQQSKVIPNTRNPDWADDAKFVFVISPQRTFASSRLDTPSQKFAQNLLRQKPVNLEKLLNNVQALVPAIP